MLCSSSSSSSRAHRNYGYLENNSPGTKRLYNFITAWEFKNRGDLFFLLVGGGIVRWPQLLQFCLARFSLCGPNYKLSYFWSHADILSSPAAAKNNGVRACLGVGSKKKDAALVAQRLKTFTQLGPSNPEATLAHCKDLHRGLGKRGGGGWAEGARCFWGM